MNSRKMISFFLSSFLIAGQGCYAEAPAASPELSSVPAPSKAPVTAQPTGQWSDGWYQGADGYARGIEEYKKTQKPMVVYMSVGWCPYCRKFEKGVLSSPLVKDFMKDMIKVNLNPEAGERENSIAYQYGIRGFPSFFLHPLSPGRAMQLYTGASPEEFIQQFEQVLQ